MLRSPLATRNGLCADITSLQAGPRDAAYGPAGDAYAPGAWAGGLCWQPFVVELDPSGKLTVTYKGNVILSKFQTAYVPSAGRLVLAGRTGGANENTHFDNLKLSTTVGGAAKFWRVK